MDSIICIGMRCSVAAIRQDTGEEVWRTKLKSSTHDFVTLTLTGLRLFAVSGGELFCLDAASGSILWNNPLPGLGYGLASLAAEGAQSISSPTQAAAAIVAASSNASS